MTRADDPFAGFPEFEEFETTDEDPRELLAVAKQKLAAMGAKDSKASKRASARTAKADDRPAPIAGATRRRARGATGDAAPAADGGAQGASVKGRNKAAVANASGKGQKNGKAGAGKKPGAKNKGKAGAGKKPAAKNKGKTGARKNAAPAVPGLVTRGVGAGMRGVTAMAGGGRLLGPWGGCALVAAVALVALSVQGIVHIPDPAPVDAISFGRVPAPKPLKNRWVKDFKHLDALFTDPDDEVLQAFAAHLQRQPSVAAVDRVALQWRPDDRGHADRVVQVSMRLRQPALPLLLETGLRAWVDEEGVVISGQLAGPEGEPEVRHYERSNIDNLREVLAVWPLLRERLPPGAVTSIDLDGSLSRQGERGIVFLTATGTRVIWGRAGEGRYGVTPTDKAEHMVHALRHLRRVPEINVRFVEPFAVVAQR